MTVAQLRLDRWETALNSDNPLVAQTAAPPAKALT
jgi:hypothetical protein